MPRWRLVDEELGKEVDISSSYCIPIKSRSIRKTLDADKEEWCIVDDGTDPTKLPVTPRDLALENKCATSATRTQCLEPPIQESPSLLAYIPESTSLTNVTIVGKSLFADEEPVKKRGRPPKPKTPARAPFVSEPRGRYHARKRPTVQFDVPASARKAAALRTAAGIGPSDSSDYPKKCHLKFPFSETRVLRSSPRRQRDREGLKEFPPPKTDNSFLHKRLSGTATQQAQKRTTQPLKIAPILQKTADATEYFEPIIYESRLRRKSAPEATRPSEIQTPKAVIEKIKVAQSLQKTAGASDYFAPTVFESRLRGKARRTTSHVSSKLSNTLTPPAKMLLEANVETRDSGGNQSDHISAKGPKDPMLSSERVATQSDYFAPVMFNSRLRRRNQRNDVDLEKELEPSSSPGSNSTIKASSASQQSMSSLKRSPRRVFSSTTANSPSPRRRAARLKISVPSPTCDLSPRPKRRKLH